MKICIRIPSLKKRLSARSSVKRVVRLWFLVFGFWFWALLRKAKAYDVGDSYSAE